MLLNNFYALFQNVFNWDSNNNSSMTPLTTNLRSMDGTQISTLSLEKQRTFYSGILSYGCYGFPFSTSSPWYWSTTGSSISGAVLYYGSGTTPVTKQDYCLENCMTTSPGTGSCTLVSSGVNSQGHIATTYKIQFIASSDITISEIGLGIVCGYVYGYETHQPNYWNKMLLLDRTLLDSPLKVSAGDAGIIQYTLTNECDFPDDS